MADRELKLHLRIHRENLIAGGIWADIPTAIDGLVDRLDPSTGIDPEFRVIHYDTRLSTGQKVRCSVCPQRQAHNDGYVVRTAGGQTGLVGNACGASHFGTSAWSTLTEVHRFRLRRAVGEFLRLPAASQLHEAAELIRLWATALATVDRFQDDCLEWFEDALARLKKLPQLGWFFDGQRLSEQARYIAEQLEILANRWRTGFGEWSHADRKALIFMERSIRRLHDKHESILKTIADADRQWEMIAFAASSSDAQARFFYNSSKRAVRAREHEGGNNLFPVPKELGEPIPKLLTLLSCLPTID